MKKVSEFMRKKVLTVTPATPIEEIWSLIFKKGIHALPVVDVKNKLLGIISEEDLLSKVYPEYSEIIGDLNNLDLDSVEGQVKKLKRFTAKELMSTTVFTTESEESIFLALSRMLMLQVRQLPVIDHHRVVIGMISKGDLFDYIFKYYFTLSQSWNQTLSLWLAGWFLVWVKELPRRPWRSFLSNGVTKPQWLRPIPIWI